MNEALALGCSWHKLDLVCRHFFPFLLLLGSQQSFQTHHLRSHLDPHQTAPFASGTSKRMMHTAPDQPASCSGTGPASLAVYAVTGHTDRLLQVAMCVIAGALHQDTSGG